MRTILLAGVLALGIAPAFAGETCHTCTVKVPTYYTPMAWLPTNGDGKAVSIGGLAHGDAISTVQIKAPRDRWQSAQVPCYPNSETKRGKQASLNSRSGGAASASSGGGGKRR